MFEHPVFGERFREELDRLFHWRRDVRRFERRPLPEDSLPSLIERACCAPSVGFSQPWRFVRVREYERRAKVRAIFEHCNAEALARQSADRASLYARLKLSGLDEAPEHVAVFVDADPATGAGLGRATMPETLAYSAVLAIHTLLARRRRRGHRRRLGVDPRPGSGRQRAGSAGGVAIGGVSVHRLSERAFRSAGAGAGGLGAPPAGAGVRAGAVSCFPPAAAVMPAGGGSRQELGIACRSCSAPSCDPGIGRWPSEMTI